MIILLAQRFRQLLPSHTLTAGYSQIGRMYQNIQNNVVPHLKQMELNGNVNDFLV